MRTARTALAVLLFVSLGLLTGFVRAATDDQNLTGLAYLADGTPISATTWADNTSFAVYVNHGGGWAAAWRYPASPSWYVTSGGAYSIVLPAAEKDVSWSEGDLYRVAFDVSAIAGTPGWIENATSHGTGDSGEISPFGSPDNAIVWNATDNWQRWDVVLLAFPDLAVLPGDVTATPGTVQVGQVVSFSATVRNLGDASATSVLDLFDDADADRVPDPGEVFDQRLVSLGPGETADFMRGWIAAGVGTHALCVYADPADAVREVDEGNNIACASVTVRPPPETRPDYVPVAPQPLTPVRTGLSASVTLSLEVRNDGNATVADVATVAFFNESSPGTPFATFPVPPLAPSATSARFTALWTSPATPGTVRVVADADYAEDLVEWNETNNQFSWTVEVLAGPVTNLVVGAPNVIAAETYVTSGTLVSFAVLDQSGAGIRNTTYRVDGGPWVNYTATGPFTLAGEGPHRVEWSSTDFAGNVELIANATLRVDDTPPTTVLTVGAPKYVAADTFVTSASTLTLAVTDGGVTPVGVAYTEYRIDGGAWIPYGSPFTLAGEGRHTVDYRSSDRLGNAEALRTLMLVVDDTPPTTLLSVGDPKSLVGGTFVNASTPITLSATDGGASPVGVASASVRVWSGTWTAWATYGLPLSLDGADGTRYVEYRSADRLGNQEVVQNTTLIVDDTPPTTTLSPATGPYTAATTFALSATDAGSGVNRTEVRIDGSAWTPYAGGFTLAAGDHTVSYRSVDRLGNREPERTRAIRVEGPPPPPPPAATNLKPLVAAVFTAILALVGAWSARRAPWPTGMRRRLRGFVLSALPFVLAEAATGVVSLLTGLLAIPPLVGTGTAVDVAILVAGVVVSLYRVRQSAPPRSD